MKKDLKNALIKQSNLGSFIFVVIGLYKSMNMKRGRLKNWYTK
jgi:hypothetical protein